MSTPNSDSNKSASSPTTTPAPRSYAQVVGSSNSSASTNTTPNSGNATNLNSASTASGNVASTSREGESTAENSESGPYPTKKEIQDIFLGFLRKGYNRISARLCTEQVVRNTVLRRDFERNGDNDMPYESKKHRKSKKK